MDVHGIILLELSRCTPNCLDHSSTLLEVRVLPTLDGMIRQLQCRTYLVIYGLRGPGVTGRIGCVVTRAPGPGSSRYGVTSRLLSLAVNLLGAMRELGWVIWAEM